MDQMQQFKDNLNSCLSLSYNIHNMTSQNELESVDRILSCLLRKVSARLNFIRKAPGDVVFELIWNQVYSDIIFSKAYKEINNQIIVTAATFKSVLIMNSVEHPLKFKQTATDAGLIIHSSKSYRFYDDAIKCVFIKKVVI